MSGRQFTHPLNNQDAMNLYSYWCLTFEGSLVLYPHCLSRPNGLCNKHITNYQLRETSLLINCVGEKFQLACVVDSFMPTTRLQEFSRFWWLLFIGNWWIVESRLSSWFRLLPENLGIFIVFITYIWVFLTTRKGHTASFHTRRWAIKILVFIPIVVWINPTTFQLKMYKSNIVNLPYRE